MSTVRTVFLALSFVLVTVSASAQSPRVRVRQLHQDAIAAYHELDLERAENLLNQAIELATREHVDGADLARLHLALGVVAVAGYNDQGRGVSAFMRALEADPTIELDPLLSTPEVQSAFQLARARMTSSARPTAPVLPTIVHTPIPEQRRGTPVPVYVETTGEGFTRVVIMFRAQGERRYQQAPMVPLGSGYGVELPCSVASRNRVEYYVVGYDIDGRVIAGSATEDQPHQVPLVERLAGVMPSLPGRPAPSVCGPPPGTTAAPGTTPGGSTPASGGDRCILDSDCGAGQRCDDGACEDGPSRPRFFLELGGTFGAFLAREGMLADGTKPSGGDPTRYASYLDPGIAGCDAPMGTNCVRVTQSGVLPVVAGRVALGYWVSPRWALAVGGRFGPGGGASTLSFVMLQFRTQYLLTNPDDDRFHASLLFGAGLGQVQVRPQQEGMGVARPYAQSGLGSISLGTSLGYRVSDHLGFFAQLDVIALFREFNMGADITLGAEVTFGDDPE